MNKYYINFAIQSKITEHLAERHPYVKELDKVSVVFENCDHVLDASLRMRYIFEEYHPDLYYIIKSLSFFKPYTQINISLFEFLKPKVICEDEFKLILLNHITIDKIEFL